MPKRNLLETYEMEHRRAEQLAFNCRWLIWITDAICRELCPDKTGTWQQRAEYAREAAEEIGKKRQEKEAKKIMRRAKKHIEAIENHNTDHSDLQFDATADKALQKRCDTIRKRVKKTFRKAFKIK